MTKDNIDLAKYGLSEVSGDDLSKYGLSLIPNEIDNKSKDLNTPLFNFIGKNNNYNKSLNDINPGFAESVKKIIPDLLVGEANLGHGLINAPHNIVNQISPSIASYIPKLNNYDYGKMIGIKDPTVLDKLIQGGIQYLPYALGGETLLGSKALSSAPILQRAAAQGLAGMGFGATQTDNPIKESISGGLYGAGGELAGNLGLKALGYAGKEISQGLPNIKKIVDSFSPAKATTETLNKLGGLANSSSNAESIAKDIYDAAKKNKKSALSHQKIVYSQIGNNKIDTYPKNTLPEGNIDKVLTNIGEDPSQVTSSQADEISSEIKRFRKHNNIEKLQENIEDILGREQLTPKQESNLDYIMSIPVEKDLKYLSNNNIKNLNYYDTKLIDLHDKFLKNPTFKNAHQLESQLNSKIRYYNSMSNKGQLDTASFNEYQSIIKSEKAISKDMDNVLKSLPKPLQDEWQSFKDIYSEDYSPYLHEDRKNLKKIAKGKVKGIKPTEIRSIFAYPDEKVQKVLSDLSNDTKNKIIYNEITQLKDKDPRSIVDFLDHLEQSKGYSDIMTDDLKEARDEIKRKIRNQNIATLGTAPISNKVINILKKLSTR
jgi:hypothetical protein